jgi:hypothetical protein
MALDVLITSDRIASDPSARDFVQFLESKAPELKLDAASLYYDFPAYADYETVTHKPDALILSPHHGVLAIRFIDDCASARVSDPTTQRSAPI